MALLLNHCLQKVATSSKLPNFLPAAQHRLQRRAASPFQSKRYKPAELNLDERILPAAAAKTCHLADGVAVRQMARSPAGDDRLQINGAAITRRASAPADHRKAAAARRRG